MDTRRGLNRDGTIAREGSLARVSPAFAPVVDAVRARIPRVFGDRLHSAYLYGSIPRGTAVPGASDLDLLVVLAEEPTGPDRVSAAALGEELDTAFAQVDGAGILLEGLGTLLSDLERHDGGFFVACLCTPLLGPDLAERLPSYRPTSLLARETNGDLHTALARWRSEARAAHTDAERRSLRRRVTRRVVRTGFTLVMPRWGGWTSDLDESAEVFGRYYPARARQMRAAATAARAPRSATDVVEELLGDLAPWLADEYTAVHGTKRARE